MNFKKWILKPFLLLFVAIMVETKNPHDMLSPYVATIHVFRGKYNLGGGTIIHPRFILTAAHIFSFHVMDDKTWDPRLKLKVHLGTQFHKHHEIYVKRIHIHTLFLTEPPPMFDVALVELNRTLVPQCDHIKIALLWGMQSTPTCWKYGKFSYTEKHTNRSKDNWVGHGTHVKLLGHYGCIGAGHRYHRFMMNDDLLCGIPIETEKVLKGSGLMPLKHDLDPLPVMGVYVIGPDHHRHFPFIVGFYLRTHMFLDWVTSVLDSSDRQHADKLFAEDHDRTECKKIKAEKPECSECNNTCSDF